MKRIFFLLLCTGVIPLLAKEIFTVDTIKQYLTKDNPFVYISMGKKYVSEEKLHYTLGNYDTKILAKYEDKDYPLTYGKFYSLGLEKPLENGVDLGVSYRYADGTQEYNNIKTSEDGEILLGIKIPVLNVVNNIDKRRLDIGLASMNIEQTDFQHQDSMRNLYFKIMMNYYKLVYASSAVKISKELLSKVQRRYTFLNKRVQKGSLSEMSLLEVKQQIINREQILLSSKTNYANVFTDFLTLLNISKEEFSGKYRLPASFILQTYKFDFKSSMQTALENRYDLKIFNNQIKKLNLKQKYNDTLKYPSFDLGLYGVYDIKNNSEYYDQMGYKVTVNMNFPIEQRKYSGKNMENKHNMTLINAKKNRLLAELRTNLKSIITSAHALEKNIESSNKELELAQQLENLELRKYELGSSTLFMLNQRELQTVKVQKKLLKLKLDYVHVYEQYIREVNLYPI